MKPLPSKASLSPPKRQKQIGLPTMIVGLGGFIGTMSYLGLFGKRIEYTGNSLF
jgi:hypothetical protein